MTYAIVVEPEAIQDLKIIRSYITEKDSKNKADKFILELKTSIVSLSSMPLRCRQSLYHEDKTIRDLIHKGYTIVFKVNEGHSTVHILSLFRQRAF